MGTLAAALDRCGEVAWDAVLPALELPDRSGVEAVWAVRPKLPTVLIVVLVRAGSIELAHAAVRAGADDSLGKESCSSELAVRTVRHAMERKRAQVDIDEERDRMYRVLDALPMFVYLQAPDHTIPSANRTFRQLFGQIDGRPRHEVFHGGSKPCEVCPPMRVQRTGEPEISEWTSAAGRTYAICDQVFPGPSPTPLTPEVGIDITDQRRAQRELAHSGGRFRRLTENPPDVIYRYRLVPKPGFECISAAVTQLSGYTPQEYHADPLLGLKVAHPDDRHLLETLM